MSGLDIKILNRPPLEGEIITKGYWFKNKYYKRTEFSFVTDVEVVVTDEILQNMFYYLMQLEDLSRYKVSNATKIANEIENVNKFLMKYGK